MTLNLSLPALYKLADPDFTTDKDFDEAKNIRRYAGRIISAATAIEHMMANIVMNTIFSEVQGNRDLVLGSVIHSDWCSFSSKRKLLDVAFTHFKLVKGDERAELESLLKKVMQYRNAFAHGVLGHNIDQQELHYFEGSPKTAVLDASYFSKLEVQFNRAWEILGSIEKRSKGIKRTCAE
jgi:hypothetical protein